MGQYYKIVNLDKREYIDPWAFGNGVKLLEFGLSSGGAMTGLAVLLADGNGRGGGDLKTTAYMTEVHRALSGEIAVEDIPYSEASPPIAGRWAGDRIVIAGDYGDSLKFIPPDVPTAELQAVADETYSEDYRQADRVNLYTYAEARYKDISADVIDALLEDTYILEDWKQAAIDQPWREEYREALARKGVTIPAEA